MKVVGADDDLRLVLRHATHLIAPLAHRLYRTFDRFRARVHGKDLVRTRKLLQILVEARELVVAKGA